jgi:hypothetical protein
MSAYAQHDSESERNPNRLLSFPSPPHTAHHLFVRCLLTLQGARRECGCGVHHVVWYLWVGFRLGGLGVARTESDVLDDVVNLLCLLGARSCWHV